MPREMRMNKLRSVAFVLGLVLCLTAGAQNSQTRSAQTGATVMIAAQTRDPVSCDTGLKLIPDVILGTAGLLQGYRATSHWVGVHMLRNFGATPVQERVVVDRNRITGAGVTAGMDMALTVIKMLRGEEYAQMVALLTEYDPAPPVHTGSPHAAGAKLTGMARGRFEGWLRDTETVAMGFAR
jgi:transcriptional regulator GlxA family with amidase domain